MYIIDAKTRECRQQVLVAEGTIDEAAALDMILRAREKVECVEQLLDQSGSTNQKRSLKQRFEKATSEPVSMDGENGGIAVRAKLMREYLQLTELLNTEFRVYEDEDSAD